MGGSHWPAAVAAATAGRDWPPAAWRGANDRLFGAGHRRGQGVVHRPPYVAVAAGQKRESPVLTAAQQLCHHHRRPRYLAAANRPAGTGAPAAANGQRHSRW